MKRIIFLCYAILLIVIFISTSIGQDRFSYGIKGGIGLWQFTSLQESPGRPIDYSYPIGFSLGFYIENILFGHFSIVNELIYQNSITKIKNIYTSYEGILDQEITTQYFIVPILLKYETSWLWDTYLLIGPSFGFLIKANYNFYDRIYVLDRGNEEITKELPTINTALEFGLGKDIEISDADFILELKAQWGLTKFRYKKRINYSPEVGEWNSSGLMFLVGYNFK